MHSDPSSRSGSRLEVGIAAGLIAGAALLAYHGSFRAPFEFDDIPGVVDNPSIRHLWSALSPPGGGLTVQGRPVLNLSLALNFAISGTRVWSYHAVNLLIHISAGLALFGIARRTMESSRSRETSDRILTSSATPVAFAIALLWTIHPVQTESVTYVIQRAESLMGMFYLLTLYCFIRGWRLLSVVVCLLGMATKEVMVTAPIAVFLYDRTFDSGSFKETWKRHGRWHLALAATWIPLALLVIGGAGRGGSAGFGSGVPWSAYAVTQVLAVAHYLKLAVWPHPLVFDYDRTLGGPSVLLAVDAAVLAALAIGTAVALAKRPRLGFLGAWFFLTLAPSSSVVPIATQYVAEHRMYLALAAAVAVGVLGARRLLRGDPRLAALALAAASLGLCWLTARRNFVYRSGLSLWSDTVAKCPANPYAHDSFANMLQQSGYQSLAAAEYRRALRLKPDFPGAHNNLGLLLFQEGRIQEASAEFGAALALQPGYFEARANLGNAYWQMGRPAEAIAEYREALRQKPDFEKVHVNLANALLQSGRVSEAIAQYETALRLLPDDALARRNLAIALSLPSAR